MKQNSKNLIKLSVLLFIMTFFVISCQKENDLITDVENQEKNFTVTHKSFSFIKDNTPLLNKLNLLSKSKREKDGYASRSNIIRTDNFTIFTDRVTHIAATDGTKESYSFYVERPYELEDNIIENLVLSKKTIHTEYSAYIITYLFPGGLTNEKKSFEIIGFQEIDVESVSELYANRCEESYEVNILEIKHNCYSGEHSGAGQAGSCNYQSAGGNAPYSSWIVQMTLFTTCDGESGGGGTTGGQPDTGSPNGNNPPSGYPDGVDTGITLPPNCQTNDCGEDIIANDINDLLDNTLSYEQLLWLYENDAEANLIKTFLGNNPTTEMKAISVIGIDALQNDGEIDLTNRLIYNPLVAQDYKTRMSEAEITIFEALPTVTQGLYLKAATQAYIYSESKFPNPVRNRKGDAFKHTFWNALSTVYIGETLTKKLTTAHEAIDYDPNYSNHYKETQMDLYNNTQGRQIANGAGRLYQLVQQALDDGELRYLNHLEFTTGFWKATDASQLTPTNK
ncbi:DUF6973 domain-containing protein [Gelidibacter salicanalis]|uniref:DUF6973 domain-containing protein n=1 Tax=Gelidibacter salicanalis TaxID=291193 RepID=A0A934KSJ4_9FLAO|nr:hypothetical protein [Gelidibacter salicanalis]MBJ7882789.1 hypothetical protein [Gelidibacter salicanalis]